ncbi:MAG: hypothetical protein QOD98_3439 [Nocardioidaceae bacterium]|nr:hypothetical protein [Nocardioidaceae bacterium]
MTGLRVRYGAPVSDRVRWRLDLDAFPVRFAVAVALAVANGVWLLLDRTSPSFDQSSYLRLTVLYNQAVADSGPDVLFETVKAMDPGRGPLYTVALMPWLAVFGDGPRSALLYNSALMVLLLLAAGAVAHQLFGTARSRLLGMVVVALTPLMVGLQHEVLVDFQLTTAACIAVAFLLRSDGFSRLPSTMLAALAIAAGTLTKVTFPAFVIGPALAVLGLLVVRSVRRPEPPGTPRGTGRAWLHVLAGVTATAAVTLPWYLPNRQATIDYVRSTTSGPLSEGAGPTHPLTLHNMATFVVTVVNQHVGLVLTVAGMVVALVTLLQLLRRTATDSEPAARNVVVPALSVATSALIPFVFLITGHNQDVRLMAPAVAAVSILVGGGLGAVRPTWLRAGLATVVVGTLAFQALNRTVPVAPDWMPEQASMQLGDQTLSQAFGSTADVGYERLPQRDRATPIYRYLEQRSTVDGKVTPRTVCLLVAHPVVNANTFGYLIAANGDPFNLAEVRLDPTLPPLGDQLRNCDFALYVKPPPGTEDADDRISLVNQPFASAHMDARLFALFPGPERSFPIGVARVSDDLDANPTPDPARVRVLARQ